MPDGPNPSLPPCVIFDIDGTLALLGDRSPFDASTCEHDEINEAVQFMHRLIASCSPETAIFLLSGRDDRWRPETERWLAAHDLSHKALYMRRSGDYRKDAVLKKEIYQRHIHGKYRVVVVFDDRDQVVKLWRDDLNLPCFQVAWGDF